MFMQCGVLLCSYKLIVCVMFEVGKKWVKGSGVRLGLEEGGKLLPEGGEGFGDDFGIADDEAGMEKGCHGEGHGHAVVVVGVDGEVGWRREVAVPAEGRLAVDGGAVAEFVDFVGEGFDAVAFFFHEGVEAGEMEWESAHAAGYCEGEGDVGHVAQAALEAGDRGCGCLQEDAVVSFLGEDAEFRPEVDLFVVALHGNELEAGEEDFPFAGDGKEFVEVRGGCPVSFDVEGTGRVLTGMEVVGFVFKERRVAEVVHELEGHLDVGGGNDGGGDGDGKSALDEWGDKEEGGDELAAGGSLDVDGAAVKFASPDEEREVAFVVHVGDVSAQLAKGIDEGGDGALAEAGGAGEKVFAGEDGEVGGEETGGGAGVADVDAAGVAEEGVLHGPGVVAVGEVVEGDVATGEGVYD